MIKKIKLEEVYRFQKIAGLTESDIDLSNTPEFNKTPNLWDEAFRDFVWDYIGDYHEHKFGETDPEDISDIVGQYLQNLRYDEVEALWSDYIRNKRAGLKENDIDLSDTPEFTNEKKQFYVYDIEGMEPPLGPYTLEHARRVIRGLSASGEDYGIVNGEVAREIWSLEEDIDLSDTPKFSGLPSVDDVIDDPSFTSFVDNEYWLNNRFGFAEIEGRVYYIPDLDEDEMKVIPLRKGISLNRLIKAGKDKGYFLEDRDGIYDTKLKQEIDRWINSLM